MTDAKPDAPVTTERLRELIYMLDTAPYPNRDSRDVLAALRELESVRGIVERARNYLESDATLARFNRDGYALLKILTAPAQEEG